MTMLLPRTTPVRFKQGESGTGVWALQKALSKSGVGGSLTIDGEFGPLTERVVKTFQDLVRITADGIAGPTTQSKLGSHLAALKIPGNDELITVVRSVVKCVIRGESGGKVAAVNWSVPGGVDCGYTQRRITEPYTDDKIQRAFDSFYQIGLLKSSLLELYEIFRHRDGTKTNERAMRLAVLNHNYPSAADKISRVGVGGLGAYWTTPQDWVKDIGAKFPDGAEIQTPLEWVQHYSLSSSLHGDPGYMVQGVDFSPLH